MNIKIFFIGQKKGSGFIKHARLISYNYMYMNTLVQICSKVKFEIFVTKNFDAVETITPV